MRKWTFWGVVCLLVLVPAAGAQTHTIRGYAVTGVNRVLSEPLFNLGPFGPIGFSDVGAFNAHGAEALPLTAATPDDALLASIVDPFFLAAFNVPPETVDPATLNIPLRDVGVYVAPDGTRAPIKDARFSHQMEPSRAPSIGAITLGRWLRASGTATIKCSGKTASLRLEMEHMIPKGLYDVWGVMFTANGPAPICLGGSPCAFITDRKGRGSFSADLNFCPYALQAGENPLGLIEILFHSDGALYGIVPELFAVGYPPGIVSHSQLEFPVSATLIP